LQIRLFALVAIAQLGAGQALPSQKFEVASTKPADPALQETLGLKLESTKGPVEMLGINSVDKPA
jgi:Protein of unknown function (DUF3738)